VWQDVPFWLHASIVATRMLGSDPLRRVFAFSSADGLALLEADCQAETTATPERVDEIPAAAA
jgi:hypothetical protein